MQNLYALLKLTTTPTKEKKRSQLGPFLNAPVIDEWVEKVLPVEVLVLVLPVLFTSIVNNPEDNTAKLDFSLCSLR